MHFRSVSALDSSAALPRPEADPPPVFSAAMNPVLREPDSLQRFGYGVAAFLLFAMHSRVLDITIPFAHLPGIAMAVAMACTALAGGMRRAFSHRVGVCFLLLTGWMLIAAPFSVWAGGSLSFLQAIWTRAFPVYLIVAGLVFTYSQLRQVFRIMAWAILTLAAMAVAFGAEGERLWMAAGRFANPNDLAAVLLMGLPFWWLVIADPRSSRAYKVFAGGAIGFQLLAMAKTGSRGGILALAVVGLIVFWRSSPRHKLLIAFAAIVAVAAAALFLPPRLKERYFTLSERLREVEDPDDYDQERQEEAERAAGSTSARRQLLQASLALTLEHPIFGVGAGQFAVAENESAREAGQRGQWQVTHNSYTEISSETGIPGLLFYLGILFFSFRALARCRRYGGDSSSPYAADLARMAICLNTALLAYAVFSAFMSVAYQPFLPVLAGLAVAVSAVHAELVLPHASGFVVKQAAAKRDVRVSGLA
jgi:O-antigen ligase